MEDVKLDFEDPFKSQGVVLDFEDPFKVKTVTSKPEPISPAPMVSSPVSTPTEKVPGKGFGEYIKEKPSRALSVVPEALLKGAWQGITTELPEIASRGAKYLGIAPETSQKVIDWAEERKKAEPLEQIEDITDPRYWLYGGAKMLAPSVIPGAITGKIAKAIILAPKLAKALQVAGKVEDAADVLSKAKWVERIASATPAGMFFLSQAQQTEETAEKQAKELESQGKFEEAKDIRSRALSTGLITGGIEALGEYFGTKYLRKLFGLNKIEELRGLALNLEKAGDILGAKNILKQVGGMELSTKNILKAMGVEITTEMGQNFSEALAEKLSGIRPEAQPLHEALAAIGPTAVMTLLGVGAGKAGQRLGREKEVLPLPGREGTEERIDVELLQETPTLPFGQEVPIGVQPKTKGFEEDMPKPLFGTVPFDLLEGEPMPKVVPTAEEKPVTPTGEPAVPKEEISPEDIFSFKKEETVIPEALKPQAPEVAITPPSEGIDQKAHEAATSPLNILPQPTEGQIEAGNYQKGHVNIQGLDISIENPRGSKRTGITKEGRKWESTLAHHYGYIRGTEGKDKDHLDTFIGNNPQSQNVFVVNQIEPKTGKFDEHKVMIGFNSEEEARRGYLANYEKGWKGLGSIASMTMDQFKGWIKEGNTKRELPVMPTLEYQVINKKGTLESTITGTKDAGWEITQRGVVIVKLPAGKTIKEVEKVALQYGGSRIVKVPPLKGEQAKPTVEAPKKVSFETEVKDAFPKATDEDITYVARELAKDFYDIGSALKNAPGKYGAKRTAEALEQFAKNRQEAGPRGGRKAFDFARDAFFKKMDEHLRNFPPEVETTPKETIKASELELGDKVKIDGEELTVKEKGPNRTLLEDGTYVLVEKPETTIEFDKGTLEKAEAKPEELKLTPPEEKAVKPKPTQEEIFKAKEVEAFEGKIPTVEHEVTPIEKAREEQKAREAKAEEEKKQLRIEGTIKPFEPYAIAVLHWKDAEILMKRLEDAGIRAEDVVDKESGMHDIEISTPEDVIRAYKVITGFRGGRPHIPLFVQEHLTPAKPIAKDKYYFSKKDLETYFPDIKLKEELEEEAEVKSKGVKAEIPEKPAKAPISDIQDAFDKGTIISLRTLLDSDKKSITRAEIRQIYEVKNKQKTPYEMKEYLKERGIEVVKKFAKAEERVYPFKEGGEYEKPEKSWLKEETATDLGSDTEGIIALREGFADSLRRPIGRGNISEVSLQGKNSDAIKEIAKGFGKQVKFFRTTDKDILLHMGAMLPSDTKTVWISVDSNFPHLQVLGHELMHHLQFDNPQLFQDFYTAIKDEVFAFAYAKYRTMFIEADEFQSENQLFQEFSAEFIGQKFLDKKFWDGMAEKNPTVFSRIIAYIEDLLSKAGKFVGRDIDNQFIKDIEKARQIAIDTMSKYIPKGEVSLQVGEGELAKIKDGIQLIKGESFDIHNIDNRRFMYNPKTNELVLGINNPFNKKGIISSHAEELAESGAKGNYDDFINGWVGTSIKHPDGVIHFAPAITKGQFSAPKVADDIFATLEYFLRNGATNDTILRNIVEMGEVKIKDSFFATNLQVERRKPAEVFFFNLQRTIEQKMPNKALTQVVRNIIKDVKQDEVKWSGIEDYLADKKMIDKQELLGYLRMNQVELREVVKGGKGSRYEVIVGAEGEKVTEDTMTKFSQWQVPGGENYREMLLILPTEQSEKSARMTELENMLIEPSLKEDERIVLRKEYQKLADEIRSSGVYQSPHFDEPNVLAHVRMNDRVDSEGNKVLFLEEIQSDWHQIGRREGYGQTLSVQPKEIAGKIVWQVIDKDGKVFSEEVSKAAADNVAIKNNQGVPPAPFSKTWHELALKRMLRYASENGYDKLAWTSGEIQAERYDLSKHLKELDWYKSTDGTYTLSGTLINGMTHEFGSNIPKEKLADHIGKEVTEKILKRGKSGTFKSLDLKVGGEGMRGFYDKIIPEYLNKYGKKWGAMVGETIIPSSKRDKAEGLYITENEADDTYEVHNNEFVEPEATFETRTEAEDYIEGWEVGIKQTIPSIDITPSMKESVLYEGQPLFQKGEVKPKATPEDLSKIIDHALKILPEGSKIVTKDEVELTDDQLKAGLRKYGLDFIRNDMVIKGLHQKTLDGDRLVSYIEYSMKYGDATTVPHEVWHGMRDFLSDKDISILSNVYKNEEVEAKAFSKFWIEQSGGEKTIIKNSIRTVFQKIADIIRKMGNFIKGLGFRSPSDIFGEVYRGEASKALPQKDSDIPDFRKLLEKPYDQLTDKERRTVNMLMADESGDIALSIDKIADYLKLDKKVKNNLSKDINTFNRIINSPKYIADKFKEFNQVFRSAFKITQDRDEFISNIHSKEQDYFNLPKESRDKVDKAIKEGTLNNKVFTNDELKAQFGLDNKEIRGYWSLRDKYNHSLKIIEDFYVELGGEREDIRAEIGRLKGYAPLSRFGEWAVTVRNKEGKVEGFETFENRFKAKQRANELVRSNPESSISFDRLSNLSRSGLFEGIDPATLALLSKVAKIDPSISDPFMEEISEFFKARGFKRHFIERKATPGFSEDWERVHADYTVGLSNYISRLRGIKAMKEGLKNIDPAKTPNLYKYAQDYTKYIEEPKEEAQALRGLLFHYYLGANLKSSVLNLTQPITTTLPYLSQYKLNPAGDIIRAAKDVMSAITVKDGKPFFDHEKLGDLGKALKEAEKTGIVNEQLVYELMAKSRGAFLAGEKMRIARALSYMFGTAEVFNRRVTFISAYRIGQKLESEGKLPKGVSSVQEFAEKTVEDTQFLYSRSNRPIIARGRIGSVFFTFKTFTLQYMEMLAKLARTNKESIHKGSFLKAIGIMFVLAGAAGIPVGDDLKKLLEKMLDKNLDVLARDISNSLFGDPRVGEVAMRGITRLGPIDMSSAIGIGDIIPESGTLQVLGPAGGVAMRVYKMFPFIKRKQPLRALETVSPEALRGPLAGMRMTREGIRDVRGQLIFSGEGRWGKEVNSVIRSLGFTPSDLSRAYERERAQWMVGGRRAEKKKVWVDRVARAIVDKDFEEKAKIVKEIKSYNEGKSPEDQVIIKNREIREAINRLLMPEDIYGIKKTPKQERREYRRLRELFR